MNNPTGFWSNENENECPPVPEKRPSCVASPSMEVSAKTGIGKGSAGTRVISEVPVSVPLKGTDWAEADVSSPVASRARVAASIITAGRCKRIMDLGLISEGEPSNWAQVYSQQLPECQYEPNSSD